MLGLIKSITSDKNGSPEIIRILSVIGCAACLGDFIFANYEYARTAEHYELKQVGYLMEKFSESFMFIMGAMAGGLTAKTWIGTRHPRINHAPRDQTCDDKNPLPQDTTEGNFAG